MATIVPRLTARDIRDLARGPRLTVTRNPGTITRLPDRPVADLDIILPDLLDPGSLMDFEPLTLMRVLRPGDLFNGTFRFHNLHRNTFTNRAQRKEGDKPAYLVLDLPGQHFGEEALNVNESIDLTLRARLAGRSRVAVEMPQGSPSVRLTIEHLLEAMRAWPLSLDPLAIHAAGGLHAEVLGAVERTFLQLNIQLWAQLTQMRLGHITSRATSLVNPLVDSAYTSLVAGGSISAMFGKSYAIRNVVEAASGGLADEAEADFLALPSGFRNSLDIDDPARVAGELAEAQLEVFFALHLTRRISAGSRSFSATELSGMSGLFDLAMHPHQPADTATALELPYRLITSPGTGTMFDHAGPALSVDYDRGERTELWTSTLRQAGAEAAPLPAAGADFYAMWSPDYLPIPNPATPDFQMSLTQEDRRHIVKRTTGHNEESASGSPYAPIPAKVRKLVLSPLGASLDAEGTWPASTAYEDFGDLVGWLHQTDLGRDTKVVVVRVGWLYPMGFPVSQIQMTERKFQQAAGGEKTAVLRKRTFLVVNQGVLSFPEAGQQYAGRALPFGQIEAITRVTPNLVMSDTISGLSGAFWVRQAGGSRFAFDFAATDDAGRTSGFHMNQIFVPGNRVDDAGAMTRLGTAWSNAAAANRRAAMAGQTVRMMKGNHPEMDMPLDRIEMAAHPVSGNISNAIEAGRRPFHPVIAQAEAKVPGVEDLTGKVDELARRIRFNTRYLEGQLGGAAQKVVLELLDPIDLDFANDLRSDAMGAIGQASQRLSAIAEGTGLLPLPGNAEAQLNALINGTLSWEDLLPDFKVLGRFALHLLLDALDLDPADLPSFQTRRGEQELEREYSIRKPILRQPADAGPLRLERLSDRAEIFLQALAGVTLDTLTVEAGIGGQSVSGTVPTNVRDPRAEAHGHITEFAITLFDLIEVRFAEIGFDLVAGRKPDARVLLDAPDPLVFHGPLEFLNALRDLIPPTGFGDGPRIIPGPLGVEAGFDLGLPNVEIGVFALKNMTLGAAAVIPFDQRPIDMRFNFNERHRPFEIAVAGFGGGGFFALSLDAGGIREIEAALEFGAQASMSIGVASGSISVKGGVYFRYAIGELILEGYVELSGRMSVLELITASLLFHMALAYEKQGGRAFVRGEATLRIEVEVIFFSVSVTLHVERRFEAGQADPRFIEMVSGPDWKTYCEAFA